MTRIADRDFSVHHRVVVVPMAHDLSATKQGFQERQFEIRGGHDQIGVTVR
jgi:hypothetical protein